MNRFAGNYRIKQMDIKRNPRYARVIVSLMGLIIFSNVVAITLTSERLYANGKNMKTQIDVKNISAKQAKELIDNEKDVFILDVRTKEEYRESHIKGSHLIPIQGLERNINKIPKDKKVVVHCASGKRSAPACEILKDKGLKELYNIEGGILKWQKEGYPVEKE